MKTIPATNFTYAHLSLYWSFHVKNYMAAFNPTRELCRTIIYLARPIASLLFISHFIYSYKTSMFIGNDRNIFALPCLP